MGRRETGVLLVVISALVFSSAGVFTKSINAGAWDIIFWRGVAAASFTMVYLWAKGDLAAEVRAFGRTALVVTVIMGLGTAAFIPAFKLSHVANVVLIYGAAPFFAAAMAWVFLRERPSALVAAASLAAFGGVLLIVSGSLRTLAWRGDLLAVFMTLMLAATMVIYRAFPQTTAALPAALSSVILLPVAYLFGDPFGVPMGEMPLLIFFGLVFAVASVTLSEGARRLPPAETALLSILEMPLAPILAYLVLTERPSVEVLLGGVVIFGAVMWSQIGGRRPAAAKDG